MHVGNIKTKSVLAWYNCNIYEKDVKSTWCRCSANLCGWEPRFRNDDDSLQ